MNKIKRMLKRWLGINYLIDLCDERDIYVNKRINDINDKIIDIDYSNKLCIIESRIKKLEEAQNPYDKDGMFKDDDVIDSLVNDVYNATNYGNYTNKNGLKDIILEHIDLNDKGDCNND